MASLVVSFVVSLSAAASPPVSVQLYTEAL